MGVGRSEKNGSTEVLEKEERACEKEMKSTD
jgi:hypothetical protein